MDAGERVEAMSELDELTAIRVLRGWPFQVRRWIYRRARMFAQNSGPGPLRLRFWRMVAVRELLP